MPLLTPVSPASGQADLFLLRDLLEKKTGLYIADEKVGRLEEPFAELCLVQSTGAGEILRAIDLGDAAGRRYLDQLVGAIATNETYFFRIPAHFETLRDYLLPEIIERKKLAGEKTLRIWSAGCSTGEEPYSVAITLLEHFPQLLSWQVRIIAIDIDLDALARAAEGVYRSWSFRGIEPALKRKYWQALPEDSYRIDERVRALVKFAPLNLESEAYPSPANETNDLDIIFCRNVTIYFRPHTVKKVLQRFHECLVPGGFLLTGAAEYSGEAYKDFETRAFPETVIYQKPAAPAPARAPAPLLFVRPAPRGVPPPARKSVPAAGTAAQNPQDLQRPRDPQSPQVLQVLMDPMARAVELVSRGALDAALVVLAELAEKNPRDAGVSFLLGQLAADRRHMVEAGYWLNRTIALDPLNLWAYYSLALVRMEEGRMEEALGAIKKTIYIDPNFALGHFYVGQIHKAQGKAGPARKSFGVVKNLLAGASLSEDLSGAQGLTGRQLLLLVERELEHEG